MTCSDGLMIKKYLLNKKSSETRVFQLVDKVHQYGPILQAFFVMEVTMSSKIQVII